MIQARVTFKGFKAHSEIADEIEARIEKLKRFESEVTRCHVVVSLPHKSHLHGLIFHISIQAHLRRKDIVMSHEPEKNHAHEDVYVAIRDAFDAFERTLDSYFEKRREKTQILQRHAALQ